MALARLTKQCHECPFVETCEHKEMEALGYLPEPIMADVKVPVTADIAAPILRETVSRVVDGSIKSDISERRIQCLKNMMNIWKNTGKL